MLTELDLQFIDEVADWLLGTCPTCGGDTYDSPQTWCTAHILPFGVKTPSQRAMIGDRVAASFHGRLLQINGLRSMDELVDAAKGEPKCFTCGKEKTANGGDLHCGGDCDHFEHDEVGGCHSYTPPSPFDASALFRTIATEYLGGAKVSETYGRIELPYRPPRNSVVCGAVDPVTRTVCVVPPHRDDADHIGSGIAWRGAVPTAFTIPSDFAVLRPIEREPAVETER